MTKNLKSVVKRIPKEESTAGANIGATQEAISGGNISQPESGSNECNLNVVDEIYLPDQYNPTCSSEFSPNTCITDGGYYYGGYSPNGNAYNSYMMGGNVANAYIPIGLPSGGFTPYEAWHEKPFIISPEEEAELSIERKKAAYAIEKESHITKELKEQERIKNEAFKAKIVDRLEIEEVFGENRQLKTIIVFSEFENVFFAFRRVDGTLSHRNKLFIEKLSQITKYEAYSPEKVELMELTFIKYDIPITITVEMSDSNIDRETLISSLKNAGVQLNVPAKRRNTIIDSFIDYIISQAKVVEIPYNLGFSINADGNWQYAGEDSLTMKKLFKEVK